MDIAKVNVTIAKNEGNRKKQEETMK